MRKTVLFLLTLTLVLSAVCFASCGKSDEERSKSVSTGTNTTGIKSDETEAPVIDVDWTVDEDGTLTISGNGQMKDFTLEVYNQAPWHSEKDKIKKIVIEDGVASIGEWAFECFDLLAEITLPDSVTFIGDGAFYRCKALKSITIPDSVTAIGGWSFSGCDDITIYCSPDSYARKYAVDAGINVMDK